MSVTIEEGSEHNGEQRSVPMECPLLWMQTGYMQMVPYHGNNKASEGIQSDNCWAEVSILYKVNREKFFEQ